MFARLQRLIVYLAVIDLLGTLWTLPAQGGAATPPAAQPPAATNAADKHEAPQTPQQKQLADDTAKLLSLANELKAELDKGNKNTLSLGVIRKAEQVEKLARKVRDEMKANLQN